MLAHFIEVFCFYLVTEIERKECRIGINHHNNKIHSTFQGKETIYYIKAIFLCSAALSGHSLQLKRPFKACFERWQKFINLNFQWAFWPDHFAKELSCKEKAVFYLTFFCVLHNVSWKKMKGKKRIKHLQTTFKQTKFSKALFIAVEKWVKPVVCERSTVKWCTRCGAGSKMSLLWQCRLKLYNF